MQILYYYPRSVPASSLLYHLWFFLKKIFFKITGDISTAESTRLQVMMMAFFESSKIYSAPYRITMSGTRRMKLSTETDYYTDPDSQFICVCLWYNNMKVKGHIPHWDTFYIYFLLNNYGMAWSLNITGDNQVGIE